jgi:double-stranded uracil-DNA glycosylase
VTRRPSPSPKQLEFESAIPDVLEDALRVLFCGINPGRISAAAAAHFANPRNDFWRLLRAAGFTPTLLAPSQQFELIQHGVGVTNAAARTTPGSGDLRKRDFAGAAERLEQVALSRKPAWIAFVGKEAYRGTFGERPEFGEQGRRLGETRLYVLPSTSPANAAVPWEERLRWFTTLAALSEPRLRPSVRAIVLDSEDRVLLHRFTSADYSDVWVGPGGAVEEGENDEEALRRELREEFRLERFDVGPWVWTRRHVWAWHGAVYDSRERVAVVRGVEPDDVQPTAHDSLFAGPGFTEEVRWWTLDELEATTDKLSPRRLPSALRDLLERGPPPEPIDVGA